MTYAELEQKAKRYCKEFPDQDPVTIFINGFIQGGAEYERELREKFKEEFQW
ncbi:MAG: hypothetical protein IK114_14185 [Fibrobacter sp.]|nr:hypothetical protein [Fibrobacter sp.]